MNAPPDPEQPGAGAGGARTPARGHRVSALALRVGGVIVLVVLGAWLALVQPWVATRVVNALLAQAATGWAIRVDSARGDWLTHLELRGLRVSRGDTLRAAADTVRLGFRLEALLAGRIHVTDLTVLGPWATVDLADTARAPGRGPSPSPADLVRGRFYPGPALRVDRLAIRAGRLRTPSRGSLAGAMLTNVTLRASQVRLGPGLSFRIDSLGLRVAFPRGGPQADVRLAATLDDGRLELRTLGWRSAGSDIEAHALAAFTAGDSLSDARLTLRARPLALRDVAGVVPGLGPGGSVTLDVDLRATRADRVSGSVTARLDGSWAGGPGWGPARLEAALADGRAQVEFSATYEHAPLRASGWIRPLDRVPTYDLTADLDRLPARLPGAAWWTAPASRSDARGSLRVTGRGYAPAELEVSARLEGSTGRVDLDGHLDLGSDVAWSVRRLTFEDLDVARLVGDTAASAVRGTLAGSGRVGRSGSRIDATMELGPSRYGRWGIAAARARAALAGAAFTAGIVLESDLGRLEVDTLAGRWDGEGRFRIGGARVHGLDLARLTGDRSLPERLDGVLGFEGHGLSRLGDPGGPLAALRDGHLAGETRVDLMPVRFRAVEVGQAGARIEVAAGRVRLTGSLVSSSGRLELDLDARPFDTPPRVSLGRARFADVDLAAWTGAAPRTRLSGSLRANGHIAGADSEQMWTGVLSLEPSRVGRAVLDSGELRASIGDGRARVSGELLAAGDRATVGGEATLRDSVLRGRFEGSVPLSLLTAIAEMDSLAAHGALSVRASFAGRSAATAEVDGRVTGSGAVGGARLDSLLASFRLERGLFVLDTLTARSNVGTAHGAGRAALLDTATGMSDLRLALEVRNAAPLRSLLGLDTLSVAEGTADLRLGGTALERSVELRADLRSLTWNDLRLLGASVKAKGTLDRDGRIAKAEGEASLRRLRTHGVLLGESSGRATYANGETSFDLSLSHDDQHGLQAIGRSLADSLGVGVAISTLEVRDGPTAWTLARPAHLALRAQRLEVDDFELRAPDGRIAARGSIDRRGEQDFRFDASGVGLGGLGVWLGRDHLEGTLGGSLSLAGAAGAPSAHASLVLDLGAAGRAAGAMRTRLDLEGSRLAFTGRFTGPGGDSLVWRGRLPLALSLAATDSGAPPVRIPDGDLDLEVVADRFPLAAFAPFLDHESVGAPGGVLIMDTRLGGTTASPTVGGHVEIDEGTLPLPRLGVTLRGIRLHGALEGDRLLVREARAASGRGTLQVSGDLRFASIGRIEPRLDVAARRFTLARTPDLGVSASGDLSVTGTLAAPIVRGTATVEDGHFQFLQGDLAREGASDIRLTDADMQMLQEAFGFVDGGGADIATQVYDASDLDLAVTLARNNWVRQRVQPRMAVALAGDVHVLKDPYAEPRLFGRIELVPGRGYVEQFARSFDIESGEVLLNGATKDHSVRVQARYQPPATSTTIHLGIAGTPEQLKLTLSSEPAMSEVEIVSYIATGRSRSAGGAGTGQGSASLVRDLGLSQLTGVAGTAAQNATGLDVVQVRYDALNGATFVAGRYVDPRLYVGILQPLQYKEAGSGHPGMLNRTSVELEYAIQRWLVLNLKGETSKVRSFLRVRHAF